MADYEAQLRMQTDKAQVAAEIEGRIKQERVNHDLRLEQSRQAAEDNRKTVMEGIKTTGETLGNGVKDFFSDKEKMIKTVAVFSAAALGIYTAKTGTRVAGRYIESVMGKPSLVRETSKISASEWATQPGTSAMQLMRRMFTSPKDALSGVVLNEKLDARLRSVATSTQNTKSNKVRDYTHKIKYLM
jgi:ATPase family AAA domain-containing protein 3A/B